VGEKAQGLHSVLAVITKDKILKINDMRNLRLIKFEFEPEVLIQRAGCLELVFSVLAPPLIRTRCAVSCAPAQSTRSRKLGLHLNNEGSGSFGRKAQHGVALRKG
jgi:hypothetical protein